MRHTEHRIDHLQPPHRRQRMHPHGQIAVEPVNDQPPTTTQVFERLRNTLDTIRVKNSHVTTATATATATATIAFVFVLAAGFFNRLVEVYPLLA
eukprot:CAMPEP_0174973536 /NCGR_PEP_ID=MMETSP0004_2-20121128/11299_1 /TAXON_ID=420556 /ORGANISM="Ochromonas sp., Strain CCMP1393" /LENGTH=94 /DNA_ID=CAMNT_0016224001 /DNA_START=446 /DNA_END=730 /DNA_ORIENTATION=-